MWQRRHSSPLCRVELAPKPAVIQFGLIGPRLREVEYERLGDVTPPHLKIVGAGDGFRPRVETAAKGADPNPLAVERDRQVNAWHEPSAGIQDCAA